MTTTRSSELAAQLRERVALGDVGPAGELDSEATLGQRYGVSRVTVRRALELLRDEGLVSSRRGAGWFVTTASFHQQLALGSFRHAASAVDEAGGSASRRVVGFDFRLAPQPVAALLRLGDDPGVLHSRSVRSVDDIPLDLATEWVPADLAGRISRADAAGRGIWQTLQAHGHVVETVRQTVTAGVAPHADAEVLGVAPGAALLLVRRLAIDPDGRPLALADHRYLAHRFSLEVEFHGWTAAGPAETPGLRVVRDRSEETA